MTVEVQQPDTGKWRRVRTFDAASINDLSQGECHDIAELLYKHRNVRLVADSGRTLIDYGAALRAATGEG